MVGLLVTSKRTYANTCLPGLLLPVPLSPRQATADHVSAGDPQTVMAGLAQSLVGHYSFPLGPGAHRIFLCVCPLRVSVSPSPLGVEELNPFVLQSQIPWGFLIPLPDPQVGKSVLGPRTFAGSLVLLFSSLWVAHLEDMGFGFIMIAPLLPSH